MREFRATSTADRAVFFFEKKRKAKKKTKERARLGVRRNQTFSRVAEWGITWLKEASNEPGRNLLFFFFKKMFH